jgi:hypothetical protein
MRPPDDTSSIATLVPTRFPSFHFEAQSLAELGFAVVTLDRRGTGYRSVESPPTSCAIC